MRSVSSAGPIVPRSSSDPVPTPSPSCPSQTQTPCRASEATIPGPVKPQSDDIAAPLFPRGLTWVNTAPLRMDKQIRRTVLIDFWDFCRPSSVRTLPYLQAWHERYEQHGLRVLEVCAPGQDRAARVLGLSVDGIDEVDHEVADHGGVVEQVHPDQGGDLVVAAATRPQAATELGTHDVDLDQIADERGNPAGLALGMDLDGDDDEHAAHARDGSAPALTKTAANRARCSSVPYVYRARAM